MRRHLAFRSAYAKPAALAVIAVLTAAAGVDARPAAFTGLAGTWSGSGHIQLVNGDKESLKCKAYYTDKGEDLGIALRCASTSYKIDLRAQLTASGSALSGSWEERQFNAAGNATGQATGNKISLSVVGGGMSAAMSVTTTGQSQAVAITTDGTAMKGANIALSRD